MVHAVAICTVATSTASPIKREKTKKAAEDLRQHLAMAKRPKSKKVAKVSSSFKSYFDSIDFSEWWEEFAHSVNKNGTQKYQTIYSFIKHKEKAKNKREFLWWILGPEVKLTKDDEHKYKSFSQYDWETKREKGFWYSSSNIEQLKREVKSKHSSMDAIRSMGTVNLDVLGQLQSVSEQLDREYNGRLFLPELSAKENTARVKLYFELKQNLVTMLKEVQLVYAKTQGVDTERLESMLAIMGPAVLAQISGIATGGQSSTGGLDAVGQAIAKMISSKAAAYDLALPDKSMEDAVKEVPGVIELMSPVKKRQPN